MIVGKVVGSIVSTRKSEKLIGNKFKNQRYSRKGDYYVTENY